MLGVDDPQLDVEVIALAHGFYRDLGLRDFTLLLNSMGDDADRARVRRERCARTCSTTATPSATSSASGSRRTRCGCSTPRSPTGRTSSSTRRSSPSTSATTPRTHFEAVQHGLDRLGIEYEIDPRLVRGFDYYTRTTFEFQSDALDAAQNAIGGGGRYDGLAEEMGGPPTPGHRLRHRHRAGADRVRRPRASCPVTSPVADVFVVDGMGERHRGDAASSPSCARTACAAERAYGGRSVKAQLKAADRSGARSR